MSELFVRPSEQESYTGFESTQAEYVSELVDHANNIPDFSQLPVYYNYSEEESTLIGNYCSSAEWEVNAIKEQNITPLYRDDILDPHFCESVDKLTRRISGNNNNHWYKRIDQHYIKDYYADSNQARYTSRKWEVAFIGYMRERHMFHAAFMQALLTKEPIDDLVEPIKQPHEVPSADPNKGGSQAAPDFMYNPTNFLTGSLLSALALPPEHCDASMKRHAIEQWARHADTGDAEALGGFYGLDKLTGPMRLPWSMRSNADLRTSYHRQWRRNPVVEEHLGDQWNPRADGLDTLLQERPKDYIQVLILSVFSRFNVTEGGLHALAQASVLAPEIKDIIFAEDAAHNTVYSKRPVLPEYNQPTTLLEYLEAGDEISAVTLESVNEGQRLRISMLEKELAAARKSLKEKDSRIESLQQQALGLIATLERERTGASRAPQATNALLEKYGIAAGVSDDFLESMVAGIRRDQNKKLQPSEKQEDLQRLQKINNDLDDILRSRGLGKNRQ